jgi:glycosyltransferase involved in cell wall biosynthesis
MGMAVGPLVSVVIPCYNQGRFLNDAIDSILRQSYANREVIVVDDGSTDCTREVAGSYGSQIRCIHQVNRGLSAARNAGLLEARGEYLLFLDADDYVTSEMLEQHMTVAAAQPDGSAFHGGSRDIDLQGNLLWSKEAESLGQDPFHQMLTRNPFPIHTITIRRTVFANVGLFDVNLRAGEDWDMWIRLAAAGCRFVPVPRGLAIYRRHTASMSNDYARMWQAGAAVLRKSRNYHNHCAACRRALAQGRHNLLDYCTGLLVEDLLRHRRQHRAAEGLTRMLRTIPGEPVVARMFVRATYSHVRYRLWALRRRPASPPAGAVAPRGQSES